MIILGCDSVNNKYNDLDKENLKGKIKTRRIFSYPFKEKFMEVDNVKIHYGNKVYYNVYGFITESVGFDSDGIIDSKTKYVYDKNGDQINEITYKISNGNVEMVKSGYVFDKGEKIEFNYYLSNGSFIGKTKYIYNNEGNVIETVFFDSNGNKGNIEKYFYSNKDLLIERNNFDEDGKLRTHKKYFHDKKGNKIGENIYNDGALYSKNTTEYLLFDDSGNWIKCIHYKNGQPQNLVEREFEYY